MAADVDTADDMLALADAVGPHVCVLKTHVDVFESWTPDHARRLRELADKHGGWLGVCEWGGACVRAWGGWVGLRWVGGAGTCKRTRSAQTLHNGKKLNLWPRQTPRRAACS